MERQVKTSFLPIRTRPDLLHSCEELLRSIWPRGKAERIHLLAAEESSGLPCSMILIQHGEGDIPDKVIGHVRLVTVTKPVSPKNVYFESLCVEKSIQGKGYGTDIMRQAERYAASTLGSKEAFLISDKSRTYFYKSLLYKECPVLSLETVGANLLRSFQDAASWYGNLPLSGWETAYDDGPIISKDDMVQQVVGNVTMVKDLSVYCSGTEED